MEGGRAVGRLGERKLAKRRDLCHCRYPRTGRVEGGRGSKAGTMLPPAIVREAS